jgi:hypothetical protein
MSVIGSNVLAGSSGQSVGGYNLTNSLRLRRSASAYLNRTPASAGNQQTWTWSGWVKRGQLGIGNAALFGAMSGSASFDIVYEGQFGATADSLRFVYYNGSSLNGNLVTTALYRDSSSWYHIVAVWNTTDATSANRMRLYVNGNEITSFSTSSYPTQNTSGLINNTVAHTLGRYYNTTSYFDGYLTEVNFVDGQALTPSSFGEISSTTGVWIPKKYTGTYGTNGFYLPFTDNSALTTSSNAGLGKDFSGNSNYWTTNNISITAGTTYDSMTDVPTLTSATAANYPTFNPVFRNSNYSLPAIVANGNLYIYETTATNRVAPATMALPSTGKFYFETAWSQISGGNGIFGLSTNNTITAHGYYRSNGDIVNTSGSAVTSGATWSSNDVIALAVDVDAGTVQFYKNNSAQGATPSYSFTANTVLYPYVFFDNGSGNKECWINFGQRPFTYTPPTGFKALNTFNLPTPTIGATASTTANEYFDTTLWTGNGTSQSITNSGSMQPDFIWLKCRSTNYRNQLYDSIRGATKALFSDSTDAEGTYQGVTAFNSNGFSLGTELGANASGDTFVGWQWKGNGTSSSNTQGSITSTVSANTTAGFSVVTYTGTGASATVGHGLGVAPRMIILKARNSTENWIVYHSSIGATNYLELNLTSAASSGSAPWNSTAPTSSVFSLGNAGNTNGSGFTFVAYVFAPIAGYSAFGSYTGNDTNTFIYTGFRPKYVLLKKTSSTGYWVTFDSVRNIRNVMASQLWANAADAENSSNSTIDFVSNGFTLRGTDAGYNDSGATYIYMAFAESPFKYANAR